MSIMKQFLRHPFMTGAIAPSSGRLAQAMTADIGIEDASLIIEAGPGTGAITEAILARMAPGAQLVLVELNGGLAASLAERYRGRPVHVVHGSAADLPELVPGRADALVSGLPWTVMADALQRQILDAMCEVLAPGGRLTTFGYLHVARTAGARKLQGHLAERFRATERSAPVWANIPPAFVHRAADPYQRPRAGMAPRKAVRDASELAGLLRKMSPGRMSPAASLRGL